MYTMPHNRRDSDPPSMTTMTNKRNRNIDIESLIESISLDKGLVNGFQQLDREELAVVLAHVANEANISAAAFKKTKIEPSSFSETKWSDFAQQFGLPKNVMKLELKPFTTPRYRLPPSLHEVMFKNAWHWQDVYREKIDRTKEEAKMRILDPVYHPIAATWTFFNGESCSTLFPLWDYFKVESSTSRNSQ